MRILATFLFFNLLSGCSQESLPSDGSTTSSSELAGSNTVSTYADIPNCSAGDDGKLYFVVDQAAYFFCSGEVLEPLIAQSGEATVGPVGPAGPGYSFQDLSMLDATSIKTVASGNTGTNGFASGTGAVNLSSPTLAVDAADAALADMTATATAATATTGLANNFGCIQVDLQPVLAGATIGRGIMYAKVGVFTSTGTANLPVRWETSAQGLANSFVLGPTLTVPTTTTERIFYFSTEFLARYVSLCVQGSTGRSYNVKVYQFYVAL